MINNLERLRPLLDFPSEDTFYIVEIIQRKKDNPDIDRNMNIIKTYFVNSIEYLEKAFPEIISICEVLKARAYIRLNKRSYRKVAFEALKKQADYLSSNDFKAVKKAYTSAAGQTNNDPEVKWVIDIDVTEESPGWATTLANLTILIKRLENEAFKRGITFESFESPFLLWIPTKNGYHIITKPFDRRIINELLPDVDVHRDNPTILFIP